MVFLSRLISSRPRPSRVQFSCFSALSAVETSHFVFVFLRRQGFQRILLHRLALDFRASRLEQRFHLLHRRQAGRLGSSTSQVTGAKKVKRFIQFPETSKAVLGGRPPFLLTVKMLSRSAPCLPGFRGSDTLRINKSNKRVVDN